MTIKAILFDADGVVIDSEMFSKQYVKTHDISYDEMLPFFNGEFKDCIVGKADLKEIIKPWLHKWKWEGTIDEFLQYWFKVEHHINNKITQIIVRLRRKGIKCYLLTNQEKYRVEYMKKEMGFDDLFDCVFSSADIGHRKPDIRFYKFVLNWMNKNENILPHEIIYFDDSCSSVDEAKKMHIQSYFYRDFNEFKSIIKPLLVK